MKAMFRSISRVNSFNSIGHHHGTILESIICYSFLLILIECCVDDTEAFNLENRLPIVKYGNVDTYFGYSVAGHEVDVKNYNNHTEKWILIGAPRGQNLQPRTNRSGALFKCPISNETNDCLQVVTDGRSSDKDALNPPSEENEIKNDQWMGATVRSQRKNGYVLVCAHRYTRIVKNATQQQGMEHEKAHFGQGLCYVLSNDLTHQVYSPIMEQNRTDWNLTHDGNYQMGTSGAFLADGTMLLGSPGFNFNGHMFIFSRDGKSFKSLPNHYDMKQNSYTGMSVTGGRYGGTSMCYVAGIPRTKLGGQVSIFAWKHNRLRIPQEFFGEQLGSSFGYEIITADVNGDSSDDLIVAAPFYFNETEGGAVYVFQSEPKKACFEFNTNQNKMYAVKLTGKPFSQFGLAMSNIGDINKDGCDDIAIGAPYEDDGVVYIYLGSQNGLVEKPSQIISPATLGLITKPIKTFGSSLSGNVDLDGNSYPDLVIGAVQSSTVIALMSRPVINFETDVSGQLKNIDLTRKDCSIVDSSIKLTCFQFRACCSVPSHQSIRLRYEIEAETFEKNTKFSRVYFANNNESNIVVKNIQVNSSKECNNETVYVRNDIWDVYTPIKFRLNYSILEPDLTTSPLNALNPILNHTQSQRIFRGTLKKDCGVDDICQSQLEIHAKLELEKKDNEYSIILGDSKELLLNITVTNGGDLAFEPKIFIQHHQSVMYIASSKSRVICIPFNETIVKCTLGNVLQRHAIEQVILRFDPSRFDGLDVMPFEIFVNTTSTQELLPREKLLVNVIKQTEIRITGRNYPEQVYYGDENPIRIVEDIGMLVIHEYEIQNLGPSRVQYLDVQINWPYHLSNNETESKWLLYITDPILIEGAMGECSENVIDPLKLNKRIRGKRNANQESLAENSITNHEFQSSALKSTTNRNKTNIINLDCEKSAVTCVAVKCELYNLPSGSNTFITVRARLWNSTLLSEYSHVNHVTIASSIQISIPDAYKIHQLNDEKQAFVLTRAYPEFYISSRDETLEMWIIIVSIIIGLLLHVLISYSFWKLGFFKRRKLDEMPIKPTN